MEIRLLHGAAIAPYIDDLARLRLTVFRIPLHTADKVEIAQ